MTNKEIFKIWSNTLNKWTRWIRPVPFVNIDKLKTNYDYYDFTIPSIKYLEKDAEINEDKCKTNNKSNYKDTAIIVDLPGLDSIKEGIALARFGFIPIPIYNGTNETEGSIGTVDSHIIEYGLKKGATFLKDIEIENNATPAFLLDSNRMNRHKMNASVFDNSWDLYPQDVPSAKFFIENNITKIIIVTNKIEKDLRKIFYKYQKEGIQFFITDGYEKIKKVKIRKPLFWKSSNL